MLFSDLVRSPKWKRALLLLGIYNINNLHLTFRYTLKDRQRQDLEMRTMKFELWTHLAEAFMLLEVTLYVVELTINTLTH